MKTLLRILQFLFALIFLMQCEKFDVIYELPGEKFVFNEGDTLRYSCSDGSADTFYVIYYRFLVRTGSWTSYDWLGHAHVTTYKLEHCEIQLESINNEGKIQLHTECALDPWYELKFIAADSEPESLITTGCGTASSNSRQYPIPGMMDISFNQKAYSDVLLTELFDQPFKVYWNMKYGIIRFEGIDEASGLDWDLAGKI